MKDQESEFSFEEIFRYLVEGAARMMKDEAELKFTDRDVESALADAYMASELNPNLPGIQQQIAAYKVHVAASVMIQIDHRNNTNDWYAILGITDEDDDSIDIETIKKKYKRMALMVHPDKNESVAAKTAIKHVNNAMDSLLQPEIKNLLDRKRMERKQSSLSSVASWPSLFQPNEKQFKKTSTPQSSWSSLFDPERMKQEKPSWQSKPKRKTGMSVDSKLKEVKFKSGYSKSYFYYQKEADYSSDEDTDDDFQIYEYE
ncbi:hypothetical protein MKX01_030217 [Papaver californicum]|nr:hypothetical protein MKX01_003255 [Papaver californicum]KAI3975587.1 hypothetical protein MKX01_030217 [Papaver californicum]